MDKKRLEELHTRALDGLLSGDDEREFATYLKDHPETLEELEAFGPVRTQLRAEVPAEQEPPYPEFFNTHLERLIRESEVEAVPQTVVPPRKSRWESFGVWLMPAAAAAVLAFFAGMQMRPSDALGDQGVAVSGGLPTVYSPIASVQVEAIADQGVGGPVIVLDGLEAIPDTVDLLRTTAEYREESSSPLSISTDSAFSF